MASFASSATTCGARKHAWTNSFQYYCNLTLNAKLRAESHWLTKYDQTENESQDGNNILRIYTFYFVWLQLHSATQTEENNLDKNILLSYDKKKSFADVLLIFPPLSEFNSIAYFAKSILQGLDGPDRESIGPQHIVIMVSMCQDRSISSK